MVNKRLTISVTPKQYSFIVKWSIMYGVSLSQIFRWLVDSGMKNKDRFKVIKGRE